MILHDKIAAQLPEWQERVKKLLKESGDVKVGEVTISQAYGGMRGVKVWSQIFPRWMLVRASVCVGIQFLLW